MRYALDDPAQVFAGSRIGHVQACPAPGGFEGFAIRALGEPVLVVFEIGIVKCPRERHEPDAGSEPEILDLVGNGFHAARIRSLGIVRGEIFLRTVFLFCFAGLPVVVDLDEIEAERLQFVRGHCGQLRKMGFVAASAVLFRVPGAEPGRLRRQLDVIHLGDRVGVGFQSQSGIVEGAEGKGFGGRIGARLDEQASVIELSLQADGTVFLRGKDHPAAAVVGDPTRNDAVSGGGNDRRKEGVAARVFGRGQKAPGAERFDFG